MDDVRVIQMGHVPTLKISDAATLEISADRAIVKVEVRVNIRDQKSALPRTTVVDNVRAVLDRITLLRSNGETLQQFMDYKDRQKTEWNLTFVAEPADDLAVQAELQDVISRLAGIEHCFVSGPIWKLSSQTQTRAEAQAQTLAIRNARHKAGVVAAELGYEVSGVAQVDIGCNAIAPERGFAATEFAAAPRKSRPPAPVLDVSTEPAMISVVEEVTVVFTLRLSS